MDRQPQGRGELHLADYRGVGRIDPLQFDEWANLIRMMVHFELVSILRVDLTPSLRRQIRVDPLGYAANPCSFYIPRSIPKERVTVDEELTTRWREDRRRALLGITDRQDASSG